MRDFINFDKLNHLSTVDSNSPLYRKIIKLSEESGELSQAFLGFDGSKNVSASANTDIMGVIEETCDVINCAIDILNHIEHNNLASSDEIKNMFESKLNKWEEKLK